MIKKALPYLLIILMPILIILFYPLFSSESYLMLSMMIAVFSCLAFFIHFESCENSAIEIIALACVIALSVAGRCVFSLTPFFKPVTAIVVIAGMHFGAQFGFLTGSLSALISNFIFAQGPWTPFQMLAWGLCGFFAGILARPLKKSRILLCIYGAFSGVLYSFITDINTVLWAGGEFSYGRYIAVLSASLPFCLIYAVSNVVFLLILRGTLGRSFSRLKGKFG